MATSAKDAGQVRANFDFSARPGYARCTVNGCIAEFSLRDGKSTSTLRRHLAGEAHNLKEYLSSGDVALGKGLGFVCIQAISVMASNEALLNSF